MVAHDDAVSRLRLQKRADFIWLITSSWDSLIKVWRLPRVLEDPLRGAEFITELYHDSAVIDFQVGNHFLASICEDGNLYLWKRVEEDSEDENRPSESFSFVCAVPTCTDLGKITDCKICEANDKMPTTLAFFTSLGFIKINNLVTNTEIFSLRLSTQDKLSRLYYSADYIAAVGSAGFLYLVDLKQKSKSETENTSFLSHTMRISNFPIHSLCIYKETIICAGDSEGCLHFVSLEEF